VSILIFRFIGPVIVIFTTLGVSEEDILLIFQLQTDRFFAVSGVDHV
jgi:hypothetical protein